MKLKKSSGSKMSKARQEIADQIEPGSSNAQTIGMVVGVLLTVGALVFALMSMMGEEEME